MSSNPLITADTLALSVSIIVSALASYRAFSSRKVLATPLYRNRALWTGTVAVMLILVDGFGIYLENTSSSVTFGLVPPPGTPEFYFFVLLTAAISAVAFVWIDSTIGVAREMDFLHRDVLGWKRFRPVAGIAVVAGATAAQFAMTPLTILISSVLLAVPAVYLGAALIVGGRRAHNETMRRYMRWMGFLVASLVLQVATSTQSAYLNFPLAIVACFLYGMSTALLKTAPLSVAKAGITASDGRTVALDLGPK
jgi:hypothetical protein